MSDAPPVAARGLVKRYGEIIAVDHVDLTVERGDVFGYLGPNGAGKTTSLRMLLGLIRPTEGAARLFGRDPLEVGARALDGVAGFVEGPRFYPYLSRPQEPAAARRLDGGAPASRIEEVLDVVELRDRGKDRVGGYSHGMRQRLGIAASLLRNPQLLLLDEPTTGLDPAGMRDMRELVRRLAEGGDHDPALQPPARRSRGALQPRRDHSQGRIIYEGGSPTCCERGRRLSPARVRPGARAGGRARAAASRTWSSSTASCASARTRRRSPRPPSRSDRRGCRLTALVPRDGEPRGALPRHDGGTVTISEAVDERHRRFISGSC